ncbi:MAG: type II toxin-antitoxin system VapC family toxin [Terracidiphilus sp.]|jgi:PIN domain nuclease of toxin-antitoxin system
MRILLDTHIFYWLFYDQQRLPSAARRILDDADAVFVSAVSFWEIAIKVRVGKLKADIPELLSSLEAANLLELPILARHTPLVSILPLHHTDPFDRLLIAQAMSEPLHLLTADPQLKQYSELVIQI